MIPQTIEQVLRDFDWHNYGMHELDGDLDAHEWPPVLAAQIAEAITPEIESVLRAAVTAGAALAPTARPSIPCWPHDAS